MIIWFLSFSFLKKNSSYIYEFIYVELTLYLWDATYLITDHGRRKIFFYYKNKTENFYFIKNIENLKNFIHTGTVKFFSLTESVFRQK